MAESQILANAAGMIAITIMIVGVIMGIWWKKRNFKMSPSTGIGKSPFRRKKHDYDNPTKNETKTEQPEPTTKQDTKPETSKE